MLDVEPFRELPDRHAVARLVDRPTLVLGSTQLDEVVDADRAAEMGVDLVRRRSGGGVVLLLPGDHLWIDAWVPTGDPLWDADVSRAAGWVGAWWRAALGGLHVGTCAVHEGRASPGTHGALVCFAGRGPGEVFHDGRKVVGVSQWRSREGALFRTCAYIHWKSRLLIELLDVGHTIRKSLADELPHVAIGLGDLDPGVADVAVLREVLLASFPGWGRSRVPST